MLRTGDPDAIDYEDTDDEDDELEDGDEQVKRMTEKMFLLCCVCTRCVL